MQISTLLSYAGGFKDAVEEIKQLESAGLDMVWVPEAYSFDAPSAMGYLAANTERVIIASGILPIYSRTPTLLAMTAAGIDYLSDGRCMLGLGASGPQGMGQVMGQLKPQVQGRADMQVISILVKERLS